MKHYIISQRERNNDLRENAMKLESIETSYLESPLKHPFTTAVRSVSTVRTLIVKITTDEGINGFGEVPETARVTGETPETAAAIIHSHIWPFIQGMDIADFSAILDRIDSSVVHNTSAKAALDIALHDIKARSLGISIKDMLGGGRSRLETDLTISLSAPEEMCSASLEAINAGFSILKVKLGGEIGEDLERMIQIRRAVGKDIILRADANQGWSEKDSIWIIGEMEDRDLDIELVEQPVRASDVMALKRIRDKVYTPIMADEAVFSPSDAMRIIQMEAADIINIKLMKTGGIRKAALIADIAKEHGISCMMGSMLENHFGVTAAVHLAMAKSNILYYDLDGPVLLKSNPVIGGACFDGGTITIKDGAGLAIEGIK